MGMGDPLFWKGIGDLSLGLRLLPRQEKARCSKTCESQPVWRDSISYYWRNAVWMGICRVRLRWRKSGGLRSLLRTEKKTCSPTEAAGNRS